MTTNSICKVACILSALAGVGIAEAQTVSVAPIVRLAPTAVDRFPFTTPPQSATSVPLGSTFFIEIWASNMSEPLSGLACAYVDVAYSNTTLVDSVPPAQDSGLFATDSVGAAFDDAAGFIDTVGGCQADPIIDALGVGEWVLVKRIEMIAVVLGGTQIVSVQDAGDASPGITLVGATTALNPADIDFQTRDFLVRCTSAEDCNDQNRCTNDFCLVGVCANTPIADCCRDAADCDDSDECTADICNPQAFCENPFEPIGTLCGDISGSDCNGADTCDGNGSCQPNLASAGAPCTDDGNECSSDLCDANGACTHPDVVDQTPCNSDGNECTDDACSGGACAHPPLAVGTACGNSTATDCDNADTCNGNGACHANFEPASTVCRGASNECDVAESCTGQSAQCPSDEHVADGTTCNSDGNECTDNICNTGQCDHPPLAAGAACGDAAVTDCDNADTCDGSGTCQANYEPTSTICRNAANECGVAESCTGQSAACPDDAHLPNGTSCTNDSYCDGAETCQAGLCQSGSLPCADIAHCNELDQSCNECVSNAECDDQDDCTSDICSQNGCAHEPLSACGLTVPLDIRPGACPNKIKTKGKGVLPVAIVATPGFDMALIDPDSLVLVRADGAGGLVLPQRRRNGKVKVALKDVATPFVGETCECHRRDGDGLDDLFIKFSARDVVKAFNLNQEEDRTLVELAIEGKLLDGSRFSATDCVQVRTKRRKPHRNR